MLQPSLRGRQVEASTGRGGERPASDDFRLGSLKIEAATSLPQDDRPSSSPHLSAATALDLEALVPCFPDSSVWGCAWPIPFVSHLNPQFDLATRCSHLCWRVPSSAESSKGHAQFHAVQGRLLVFPSCNGTPRTHHVLAGTVW